MPQWQTPSPPVVTFNGVFSLFNVQSASAKFGVIQDRSSTMRQFSAVIERCPQTKLYVGFILGVPGAHTQGETLDELQANLKEVLELILEDGIPVFQSEFVGIQQVVVA